MENKSITREYEFLGAHYKITKYFGSNVVELEVLHKKMFGRYKYQRIYFGHIDPLKETVEFFESSLTPQQKDK